MKFIVTAGGQGTKIWPYSRKDNPKQFQKIIGDESLFTYNINLLLKEYKPSDIYISTKRKYIKLALDQAPEIPIKNYIIEPDYSKNRGPGEGFAFLKLSLLHPDEPFMIVQSDDIRIPSDKYLKMVKEMEILVKRDKKFITGGIKPDYPVLGVDYIQIGNEVPFEGESSVHKVQKFIFRNNDYKKTKQLVEKDAVVIHCNHACWYPDQMLDAYKKYRPDWYASLMQIKSVIGQPDEEKRIEEIYSEMEEGSTEEVTKHVFEEGYVVSLPYNWIDIGTWDSLYEYMSENGKSYVDENVVAINSKGTLVKSHNKNKLVAVLGLDNMVVVDTEDILLIVPRDKAGDIKHIHQELKDKNLESYL